MSAFRLFLLGVLATLLLSAQSGGEFGGIQRLLPADAKIIETAEVHLRDPGKHRSLVLWMLHPQRVVRQGEVLGCSEFLYGDHWFGPVRLSLVDTAVAKVVNTVEIRGLYEGTDDPEHGFPIPFSVLNNPYFVPKVNQKREGRPWILHLRDLTGEGVAGQFVLFEYEVCGSPLTSVFGYSPGSDRAVQYQVESPTETGKLDLAHWVPYLFSVNPLRPGHWKFTWEPGHGADCWIHEEVLFNRARQIFVEHNKIEAYPDNSHGPSWSKTPR